MISLPLVNTTSMANYKQGTYTVKNKEKYVGSGNPRYLSSWELEVFKFFDEHPSILKWGSENIVIPYYSPADERNRRYMVDLFVEYRNSKGEVIKEIVEVKPFAQTQPPQSKKGKKKESYLREVYTWSVNQAKWQAAAKWAKLHKMKFRVITEKDIFV